MSQEKILGNQINLADLGPQLDQYLTTDLVTDLSPQLGADLDVNGFNIIASGSGYDSDNIQLIGADTGVGDFFAQPSNIVLTAGSGESYSGDITLTSGNGDGGGDGGSITLVSGNAIDGGTAGPVNITGGEALSGGLGGDINISAGSSNGVGAGADGGVINIIAGNSGLTGAGGTVNITGGNATADGEAGDIVIDAGDSVGTSDAGDIRLNAGLAPFPGNFGSSLFLNGGTTTAGGSIQMQSGSGRTGTADPGGGVIILAGDGDGIATGGTVFITSGDGGTNGDSGNISLKTGDIGSGGTYGHILFSADIAATESVTVRFKESLGGGNYIGLKSPDAITTSRTWVLPDTAPNDGDVLQTDGSGNLSFVTPVAPVESTVLYGTTGAQAIDLSSDTFFYPSGPTTGIITFAFNNPAATGTVTAFTLKLVGAGDFAPVWPASVEWPSATEPTWTAAAGSPNYGADIVSFITHDGGTTWYGMLGGLAFA